MILMRVGDKNCCDGFAAQGREQPGNMISLVRSGIDDRHFALADDIAAGSGEGHRPGITRGHPADKRRKADEFPRRSEKGTVEGNFSLLRRGVNALSHCHTGAMMRATYILIRGICISPFGDDERRPPRAGPPIIPRRC